MCHIYLGPKDKVSAVRPITGMVHGLCQAEEARVNKLLQANIKLDKTICFTNIFALFLT